MRRIRIQILENPVRKISHECTFPLKAFIHAPAQETLPGVLDMNLMHVKAAFLEFITAHKSAVNMQLHLLYF
jgi:hypothetical protein